MKPSTFVLKKPKNIRKRTIEDVADVKEKADEESNIEYEKEDNTSPGARLNQLDQHFEADESTNVKVGPQKPEAGSADNFRHNVRFDYAPDLCKDYLETGFCGFGDSCKFVHDRGDYKMGWELDADWEAEKEQRRKEEEDRILGLKEADERTVKIEEITACGICGSEFGGSFVETKCKHRFCEKCALSHGRKSKKCFTCQEPVNGQFTYGKVQKK